MTNHAWVMGVGGAGAVGEMTLFGTGLIAIALR